MFAPTDLDVGETVPDFELPDQRGDLVSLDDLLEDGPAVVFFYVKDDTPGCTRQACRFRDEHADFVDVGATVAGISSDPVADHAEFADAQDLPYRLLSDVDHSVRERYGVRDTLGFLPGRVTFVIDADRTIRHVYGSQLRPSHHVDEALKALD